MADQSDAEPSNANVNADPDIEALRLRRHAILSTALPFPKLDWSKKEDDAKNLKHLRDYSESLANSALDWYLNHHKSKKRTAQFLHFVIFSFAALAAIPPLLKVGFGGRLDSACGYCVWLNDHTGELALVFLGIAGVAKLWDSNGGYTVDWMRFITTAALINQELNKFQFDWDKIDFEKRDQPDRGTAAQKASNSSEAPAQPPASPIQRQIDLAAQFCEQIFRIVGGEIAVWAVELRKRYDKAASQPSAQDK
jgi:hypothetical protein